MQASEVIHLIAIPAMIAVWAYAYSIILTDPGMILCGVANWLHTYLPSWLHKPIMTCAVCHGGQVAFWLYLIFERHLQPIILGYNPLLHLFFVAFTILIITVLSKWLQN